MMFISNEVKMICKKLIEVSEGGKNFFKDDNWDRLWGNMYEVANMFEIPYMLVAMRKAKKTRIKAQVMLAVTNGFQKEEKATQGAKVSNNNALSQLARGLRPATKKEGSPIPDYYKWYDEQFRSDYFNIKNRNPL